MTGSFTQAAESLRVSQPTISKAIKDMEEELGVHLFDRTGKKAELTNDGQTVLAQSRDIVQSFENLTTGLNPDARAQKGKLRIGLPPMAGAGYFPEIIGRFHERYPGISLELMESGARKIEDDIESGALDIGVVLLPTKQQHIYHTIPIADERLAVIVHVGHPLASRESVTLKELAGQAFILFQEDFALHGRISAACLGAGFQPRIVCESSQWDFIGNLVAAKLGISLLPKIICRRMSPDRITVLPLADPVIPWSLAFVWRKDRYLSFAAREWIRFVRTFYPNV
ncbi:LysR family transcriptional regulator [Cohnella faecalis]|uniref:LysR family transcriptional regulator n=2 Tax=Cohnella faecalis TaxID=2315694 RepID=A0A398CUJ3_9BACL|nr:LysR family transcriptional regulator [Cohnella faecalis]